MTGYQTTPTGAFRPHLKTRTVPAILLVISMLCLSLNHVIGRAMHQEVPPIGLGFWRWAIGALFLLPFIWANRKQSFPIVRDNVRGFLLLAILLAVSSTSVLVALHFTTATNAALINATQPTITAYLAWVFLKERFTWMQKTGVIVAFLGVVVMLSQGNLPTMFNMNLNLGDLIVVCAMFSLASYTIKFRILPTGLTAVECLFFILVFGSSVLFPFYLVESFFYQPVPASLNGLYTILAMALIVVVLGLLTWNIGIQLLGPAVSSIFLNLIPVFGAIMAILFLGESYHPFHAVSLSLVCCGMLLVLSEEVFGSGKN